MDSKKLLQRLLLFGLTMLLFLLAGCGAQGDDTELGTNRPPIDSAQNYYRDRGCSVPEIHLTMSGEVINGYVAGQLVLTGFPEDITKVVQDIWGEDYPNPFENPDEPLVTIDLQPDGGGAFEDFNIQLFQLQSGYDVLDVVERINEVVYTVKDDEFTFEFVFAEPNFITGNPCPGCSGGINGAPCAGCSGGINGAPATAIQAAEAAKDVLASAQEEFLNQWAFGNDSGYEGDISLYKGYSWNANGYVGRFSDPNHDIEIAVFDTVPSSFTEGHLNIYWASVPFELCVWKPGLIIDSESSSSAGDIDVQDHGLFVTGLAQGVAPGARYFLIESLDAEAHGDAISLLFGMNEYAKYRRGSNGSLNNTVINLSLGLGTQNLLQIPDSVAEEFLNRVQAVIPDAAWVFSEELKKWPYPSVALTVALTAYDQEGAVIVAAAGNEFGQPIQIPAGLPNVLGISSNNTKPVLSCFSNFGDIAAPGGDGDASCSVDLIALCQEFEHFGDCPYAVISLVSNPYPAFGYWAGTSMSTPLVSGLAALVIQKCPNIPPGEVRRIITNGVTPSTVSGLGKGIVNVEQTLDLKCPLLPAAPTPTP